VWHIAADWVEVFSPTVFGPLDTQLRTEAPDDDPLVRPQQPVIQLPLVRAMAKSNTSALRRVGRCREHTRLFVRSVTPRPHGADRSRQRSITSQLVVTG
jgi:hypothetical protein